MYRLEVLTIFGWAPCVWHEEPILYPTRNKAHLAAFEECIQARKSRKGGRTPFLFMDSFSIVEEDAQGQPVARHRFNASGAIIHSYAA